MSLDHFRIPPDSTGARVRTQRTLDLNYVVAKSVVKRDMVKYNKGGKILLCAEACKSCPVIGGLRE